MWNSNWNLLTDPTHCDPLYHEPHIFWPSSGAIFQSKNKSHAIWYRTTSVFNCLWGVLKNWTTWSATRLSASIHVKHEVSTSYVLVKYSKLKFQKFHFINGGRTVDSLNENPRHGFIHRIVYRDTNRNLIVVDLKKITFFLDSRLRWWTTWIGRYVLIFLLYNVVVMRNVRPLVCKKVFIAYRSSKK